MPHIAHEQIRKAAITLTAAVNAAENAYENGLPLDTAFDQYTAAAKSFAGMLLAERISTSFASVIDPQTGKSTEDALGKEAHAHRIRGWLSQWNFGIAHSTNHGDAGQLFTDKQGPEGRYTLKQYRGNRISRWDDLRKYLLAPVLHDVTPFVHQRTSPSIKR